MAKASPAKEETAPKDVQETATPVLPVAETIVPNKDAKADEPPFEGAVQVTITKLGDGLVSKGIHIAGEGDVYAKRGEKIWVTPRNAAALEATGRAEAD